MEVKDYEYEKALLRKKELAMRIEENKKLIELLQGNSIRKNEITPIDTYKKYFAVRKIQNKWKQYIILKRLKKEYENNKKKEKFNHTANYIKSGGNLTYKNDNGVEDDKITNPYDIFSMMRSKKIMKHVTSIQKKYRRRLKIKNEQYLKHYYTKEFERILLDPIKPEKCEAVRQQIIKFINSQNYSEIKRKNLKLLLTEYVDKYLKFNLEFPYIVDLRNENFKLLNKCLEEIAYLSMDQDLSNNSSLKYFDKFYFELENKEKAKKEVDQIIYEMEHKYYSKDLFVDDLEERNLITEIDAHFGYREFFKDIINK